MSLHRTDTWGFQLKRFEGQGYLVRSSEKLDREKAETFSVTVACSDRGIPRMSAQESFQIR